VGQATFEIIKPGIFSTVQDLGRKGFLASGIPPSGAMDRFALKMGNLLVRNAPGEAGIEMTAMGLTMRMIEDRIISFTGGVFHIRKNGMAVSPWQNLEAKKDDVISVGKAEKGWRGYLCVAGGIDVPAVLGSKSTYAMGALGGFRGRPLKSGDMIQAGPSQESAESLIGRKVKKEAIPDPEDAKILRVVMGPQDDYVAEESIETFLTRLYRVSNKANRVGYRFEGPKFRFREIKKAKDAGSDPSNIVDDGNAIGAIQIPGGVEPICLAVDGVSMGGYVKIACLIAADMDRMAQLRIGDPMRFQKVTVDEARHILRQKEDQISEKNIERV
jgi:antagonist of KipI